MFAFYKLKNGPFGGGFLFLKITFSLQKEEKFRKLSKQNNKKTHFYKLKIGPIMLRNILGPALNNLLGPVVNL